MLERRFPQFHDGLVTAVELDPSEFTSDAAREMLRRTRAAASRRLQDVDVSQVINYRPLARSGLMAAALVVSIVLFGVFASSAFAVWVQRLYGLSDQEYPRRTLIHLLGFDQGEVLIARGTDLAISAKADANRPKPPPDVCSILYTTEDGERGRINMKKTGAVRDGFQHYSFAGKPFTGILSDITFDVVGGDYRLRDQRVRVVDSPQVIGIDIDCELPSYTGLLPRTESYRPGLALPRGSRMIVNAQTNKPIASAEVHTDSGEVVARLDFPPDHPSTTWSYAIERLTGSLVHEISLLDTDGIRSARPYRISISAVEDLPPEVSIRLRGIGPAVTPLARIPIEGQITDDFGIDRSWITLITANGSTHEYAVVTGLDGLVDAALDLRELGRDPRDPILIEENSKIVVHVDSADRYDLGESPNIGQSEQYELEVVSPSQLLAMLEARELGLRRRFDQIISELNETRDSLNRVELTGLDGDGQPVIAEERDAAEAEEVAADAANAQRREQTLRLLRVQRAGQYSQRASQEVLGVAVSFDDIREELINNRVDSAERQQRISRDISQPLTDLANEEFPELSRLLRQLEQALGDQESATTLKRQSLRQLDDILLVMERVRDKMLDLETYNELVDLVRSLIREQDELIEKTKKHRKKRALDLLK